MEQESVALEKKVDEFLGIFQKGEALTRELLKQNEMLRYRVAQLESVPRHPESLSAEHRSAMEQRLHELEEEKRALLEKYRKVEEENMEFANRYVEVETENHNLANLYVASYQLHSTLDFSECLQIILEIVMNLVGAEEFSVMLVNEKTNELSIAVQEGMGSNTRPNIRVGDGIVGGAAKSGDAYYREGNPSDVSGVDYEHPLICIPLMIKEHVIGVIVIYKLLIQKKELTAADYELFSMLAGHAATAVFSSQMYSQSKRKLSTIQGFIDVLLDKPTAQ
jgi:nitrate/nitrite-specific signal transduction histidine kinase